MRTRSPELRRVVSDERRVHRPLDAGDVDLDALDLHHGLDALAAVEGRRVALPAGLAVQRHQLHPIVRKRERRICAEDLRDGGDELGHCGERTSTGGATTARTSPRATWSPARAVSSVTVPATVAATTCSIFIASSVAM